MVMAQALKTLPIDGHQLFMATRPAAKAIRLNIPLQDPDQKERFSSVTS
jgi:hypothetical protein